jgi:hypothetical protein
LELWRLTLELWRLTLELLRLIPEMPKLILNTLFPILELQTMLNV